MGRIPLFSFNVARSIISSEHRNCWYVTMTRFNREMDCACIMIRTNTLLVDQTLIRTDTVTNVSCTQKILQTHHTHPLKLRPADTLVACYGKPTRSTHREEARSLKNDTSNLTKFTICRSLPLRLGCLANRHHFRVPSPLHQTFRATRTRTTVKNPANSRRGVNRRPLSPTNCTVTVARGALGIPPPWRARLFALGAGHVSRPEGGRTRARRLRQLPLRQVAPSGRPSAFHLQGARCHATHLHAVNLQLALGEGAVVRQAVQLLRLHNHPVAVKQDGNLSICGASVDARRTQSMARRGSLTELDRSASVAIDASSAESNASLARVPAHHRNGTRLAIHRHELTKRDDRKTVFGFSRYAMLNGGYPNLRNTRRGYTRGVTGLTRSALSCFGRLQEDTIASLLL